MSEHFNNVIQATEDASCSNPKFIEKVESRGGFIDSRKKRVNGDVAVPCAIGRYLMQAFAWSQERKPSKVVDHKPTMTRLCLEDYPRVIQASDGLWNVIKTDEVAQLILEKNLETPGDIAQILVEESHVRWESRVKRWPPDRRVIDDITVQVTHFTKARKDIL